MGATLAQVTVGTRGSALAVRQTNLIVALLRGQNPGTEFVIRTMLTTGDRIVDRPVSAFGDKGVFVRAIEQALLGGEIDIAVHSLKDVPSDSETSELRLAAFSPREDPRDVLVSRSGELLHELKAGAKVGTSSLRRRAQLMQFRPDVRPTEIRGNVDTRLRKLARGEYDAILLAAAGLLRLGLGESITQYLPVELFTPDAGQGILAMQTRVGDAVEALVHPVDDPTSRCVALAERAVVRSLEADCRSPVGAYARREGNRIVLLGMAASEDGSAVHRLEQGGCAEDAEELGAAVGHSLLNLVRG